MIQRRKLSLGVALFSLVVVDSFHWFGAGFLRFSPWFLMGAPLSFSSDLLGCMCVFLCMLSRISLDLHLTFALA